jgi:hypothetical protein
VHVRECRVACTQRCLLLLLLLQVTLFIGGVLCGDGELRAALEPFGELLRAFVVTNPQVRRWAQHQAQHILVYAVVNNIFILGPLLVRAFCGDYFTAERRWA